MGSKIVLIDGHSILNRAFYGVPELTNSKGLPTNAVYGFLNILFKVLEEEKPEFLTVAFDVKHPTFRHEQYAQYKATRKPSPKELSEQVPIMKDVLKAMGVTVIERPGYEADDVLGTIAKKAEREGYEVSLVSGDRDLLQLATNTVKIRIPKTKFGNTVVEDYYENDVKERYGVSPLQIIDLKGLMGDASDNIPGVPGIGEKTATKIVQLFDSVENAIEHAEEVTPNRAKEALKAHSDLALLSKELATIKTDCELEYTFEQSKLGNVFTEQAYGLFKQLEFKSLIGKFEIEDKGNESIENAFQKIHTMDQVQKTLEDLGKSKSKILGCCVFFTEKRDGFSSDGDGQFSMFHEERNSECIGWSISGADIGGDDRTYFISGTKDWNVEDLNGWVGNLLKEGFTLVFPSLKNHLALLPLKEGDSVFDAEVAAYLLNPLKDGYDAEDLARDYLGTSISSYADCFGKKDMWEAYQSKEEEFIRYACYQSHIARMAYPILRKRLQETQMWDLYCNVEMPLIFTLHEMEARGIGVHKEELNAYGKRLGESIGKLESDIYKQVGETFNINSPKQLGVILFEKLKLPCIKKTKTGYSTSADVLEKIRLEDPVIPMILEYRHLTKLKSTYADGLAVFINEKDGRIHGKFNQTITATGRISSTEPNLQNIPIRLELGREIRKVFVPKEGYVFLDADYSQIELRVLAHMSGDESLIQAYREDQDIHKITASKVFHTPLDEVTGEQRSNAKAVNFGIVYGISSFGLGQGLNITNKEAGGYIDKYFETYPKIKAFLDGLVNDAKENGYGVTIFKRRRPIPELKSSNYTTRSFGERVAMNSPIQGTAADIIKIAMVHVNRRLKKEGLRSELILQVHDELLVETHQEEIERVKEILHDEMFHAATLKVPLEVEVTQGNNWYEAK